MPLLIKLIDAAQNLSVQVHPHDSNAHLTGGEPKTEMWYVIDATDDARIYAGLKEGTTPESFRAAIHDKSLENVLHSFKPRKGDVFFIPGGRVHAIGAGCLLLEVQQNSNTTYRVYDWGRVDAEGNSRPLHVDQALQVINWHDADSPLHAPARSISTDTAEILSLLDTEWFSLLRLDMLGEHAITGDGSSFKALFVESGSAFVRTNEGDTLCQTGQSCLVPAAIQSWSLVPDSDETRILIASV
jgi:mannose-6-phosphate isomerase